MTLAVDLHASPDFPPPGTETAFERAARALRLADLGDRLVEAAAALTGAEHVWLLVADAEGGGATRELAFRGPASCVNMRWIEPRRAQLLDPVLRDGAVVHIEEVNPDDAPKSSAVLETEETVPLIRSWLGLPVQLPSQEPCGGIFLGHSKPRAFPPQTLRLASGLAAQAAVALDGERLERRGTTHEAVLARAEEALLDSESRHRGLLQSLPAAVYTCDLDGGLSLYNDAAAALWGHAPPIGADPWIGAWRFYLDDGQPLPADQTPMALVLQTRKAQRGGEFRLERPDGVRRRVLARAEPIFDPAGAACGVVNLLVDLDDQGLAPQAPHELRPEKTVGPARAGETGHADEHRRVTRMAAVGKLSAGLGHDMANLLVPIRIRLDSLSSAGLTADLLEDVEAIRTSADYLQRLANGLRMLTVAPSAGPGEFTDLTPWWKDAEPMLRNALPRGVRLMSRFPEPSVVVPMSRAALTQAVFHLVHRAGEALRPRGSGCVTVWCEQSGSSVSFGVTDDGPGAGNAARARGAESLPPGDRTEISLDDDLSSAYDLVRDAGGTIQPASQREAGDAVSFSLPAPGGDKEAVGGSERRALVALNDVRLRAFVIAELKALGVTVTQGLEARDQTDLLVLDDASRLPAGRAAWTLLLDEGPAEASALMVLGRKPAFQAVREALRRRVQSFTP